MKVIELQENLVYALTAKERLNVFKENKRKITSGDENIIKWREIKNLANEDSFNTKLDIEEFDINDFNYALKDLDETDKDQLFDYLKDTKWYNTFLTIINQLDKDEVIKNEQKIDMFDLGYIIRPFTYYCSEKVQAKVKEVSSLNISYDIVMQILNNYNQKILNFFSKVFIIELNLEKENDGLIGETKEKRFEYFIKKYFTKKEDLLKFYCKYATLTRIAVIKTDYFIKFITDALERLDDNFEEIKQKLDINNIKDLKYISLGEGDSHQEGKSVLIYEFEEGLKLVYKPKCLQVVESYNSFINYINEKSNLLDIKVHKGLYFNDYSFEQFIEYKECSSNKEIIQFYKRFGQTIAIAYILCGNDFHLENLIAHGEYPMLIDLETLVQPSISFNLPKNIHIEIKEYIKENTIMETLLLPTVAFNDNLENIGIDISALRGKDQKLPYKVLMPVNMNTDEIKYEYNDFTRMGSNNLPILNGKTLNFTEYTKHIIEGFKEMMNFFNNDKDNMTKEDSILNVFRNIVVRNVLKGTQRYHSLLSFSTHYNYSIDMLKREKLLENMWAYPYENKTVVKHETLDMIFDDIPIFFSLSDSKDIITSDNHTVKDFFKQSGIDRVFERINKLNNKKIQTQISYMTVSLGLYEEEIKKLKGNRSIKLNKDISINYKQEAIKIGEDILSKAFYSDDNTSMSWIDVVLNNTGNMEILSLNESFYAGLSGVAFFFYELYKLTNIDKYNTAYSKIMDTAIDYTLFSKGISAFEGKLSLVFPILNEYKDKGNSKYLYFIDKTITEISESKDKITSLDWINGISGVIWAILNSYDVLKNKKHLEIAIGLGHKLLDMINIDELNSVGMGHGCTGLSLSLFRLNDYTRDECFKNIAIDILNKERKILKNCSELENKWCKGLIGSGIGRLEILKYYKDNLIEIEIKDIVNNSVNSIKNDDCLCHGNMGDIELLLMYKEYDNDEYIQRMIDTKSIEILNIRNQNSEFSVRSIPNFTSIDLFTGLSGIGYQFLRIAEPKLTSNALTLSLNSRV